MKITVNHKTIDVNDIDVRGVDNAEDYRFKKEGEDYCLSVLKLDQYSENPNDLCSGFSVGLINDDRLDLFEKFVLDDYGNPNDLDLSGINPEKLCRYWVEIASDDIQFCDWVMLSKSLKDALHKNEQPSLTVLADVRREVAVAAELLVTNFVDQNGLSDRRFLIGVDPSQFSTAWRSTIKKTWENALEERKFKHRYTVPLFQTNDCSNLEITEDLENVNAYWELRDSHRPMIEECALWMSCCDSLCTENASQSEADQSLKAFAQQQVVFPRSPSQWLEGFNKLLKRFAQEDLHNYQCYCSNEVYQILYYKINENHIFEDDDGFFINLEDDDFSVEVWENIYGIDEAIHMFHR